MLALRVGVFAGAIGFCSGNNPDGNTDCPCLGVAEPAAPWAKVRDAGAAKDCHWLVREWLIADDEAIAETTVDGVLGTPMKCMLAQVPHASGDWTLYPQSYGARCFNHKEVGNKGCFWMGDLADNNDMDGVRVTWPSSTATADILSAIQVPTADGRTAKTVGTSMIGQALAAHEGKPLEQLCDAGESCQMGEGADAATVQCTDAVDNCDLKIYNDAISDQSQHLAPSWCGDNVFCYVDGCQCGTAVSKSDYFPEQLDYSYVTCGAADVYAAQMDREQESATSGCNAANSDTTSSLATTRATCGIATVAAFALMTIAMRV